MALAERVVADSPFSRVLHQVRIYRGLPDPTRDPKGHTANVRQTAAWRRSPLVAVTNRPLRYPSGWPAPSPTGERPQEKGIDVARALDFAIMAVRGQYDVGIIFSTDSDLKPALEIVAEMTGPAGEPPRAEVAAWAAGRRGAPRLSISTRNVYCHWLGEDDYRAVRDETDYAPPAA